MKRFLMLFLPVGLLLYMFLPLEGASEKPKRGGTLTVAVRKEIRIMNPLVATSSADKRIRQVMFEPLLGMDLKGNIHPNLAEAWEILRDGKLYSFKLRKGVKFHNGQEVTSEDAKFAMDYTMNPKNGAYGYYRLRIVDRVEAPDKYTLKVYLKAASAALLSSFTDIEVFSVIPKESIEEGVLKPTKYPPGTGPFKFVEWQPKRRMVFDRFDDYWGHKAFIDRLVERPIRNDTVRMIALRAGDVDMAERIPYEWVARILGGKLKGIFATKATVGGFRQIKFNVASPPFNNKTLRQAVAHAINRKEILDAAWFGYAEPTDQRFPKGAAWYIGGVAVRSLDLNKAKALLKEAGYRGQTIKLLVNKQPPNQAEATTLQAQLKKIGMNIDIESFDSGTTQALLREGKFAFNNTGGRGIFPDPSPAYGRLLCEQNPKKRTINLTGYCDKELDILLNKGAIEVNPDKRKALFKQIVTKVNEDLPVLYLGVVPRFWGLRGHVKGFAAGSQYLIWWGGGVNYVWLDK